MGLRVLLTGEPKVGKSTIIKRSLEEVKDKSGFWTSELRNDDQRHGFITQDDKGQTVQLASVYQQTAHQIGRFYVDTKSFDQFLRQIALPRPSSLIYIDEIGRMQMLSNDFRSLLADRMSRPNMMIGTIAKENHEPLMETIKNDPETILVEVSLDNREEVLKLIQAIIGSHHLLKQLTLKEYERFIEIARSTKDITLLYKLFHNALLYVVEKRVVQKNAGLYEVQGQTSVHHLSKSGGQIVCDCPLYATVQNCSHVFAIRVAELD